MTHSSEIFELCVGHDERNKTDKRDDSVDCVEKDAKFENYE